MLGEQVPTEVQTYVSLQRLPKEKRNKTGKLIVQHECMRELPKYGQEEGGSSNIPEWLCRRSSSGDNI